MMIEPDFSCIGYIHTLPSFGKKFDINVAAKVNIDEL